MKVEIWTKRTPEQFGKYLSKALGDHGVRYDALKLVTSGFKMKKDLVVLACGRELFDELGEDDTLEHLRGSIIPRDGGWIIYTYSPVDQTLGERKMNLFQADMSKAATWWKDVEKFTGIIKKGGYKPPQERFITEPSFKETMDYLEERITKKEMVAVDLETIGRRDDTRVFLFGLSHNAVEGICIPFLGRYRKPYWSSGEYQLIWKKIEELLNTCPQIYQNALFDVKVLRLNGFKFPLELVAHDTMLLHHTIDSALPHTLDFITSIYGDTPYWKATMKQNVEKLSELPLEESGTYNIRDCVTLFQVLPKMLSEAREEGLMRVYEEEAMAGIPAALEQMETRVSLNLPAVEVWRKEVSTKVKKYEKELRNLWPIPKSFKLSSNDHIAWLVGNQPLKKFEKIKELKHYEPSPKQACRCADCNKKYWAEKGTYPDICTKCGSTTFTHLEEYKNTPKKKKLNNKGEVSGTYQSLLDLQELAEIPRFYIGRFKIKISAKTKKIKTDEKARQKLRFDAQRLLEVPAYVSSPEKLKKIKLLMKWLETYDKWAHAEKQRSTYTQFPVWDDGKLHYLIKLHGTETGRPASGDRNDPMSLNILNQPSKKEKLLGRCYTGPKNHVVVSMDYSNLEARVVAYVVKDPVFIKAVEGGNLHDVNTKALFGIDETDRLWKTARGAAKIFQFGRIQYGGGREIYEQIVLACPQLDLSYAQFETLTDNYFRNYEVFGTWREETSERALATRKSYTAFGRVRHLYGHSHQIVKQAYNFPGQGTAAGVMNRVQGECIKKRNELGLKARLQVQIYDDLRWVCPPEEVDQLVGIMKPIMEQEFDIFGVKRSFPTDVEVGPNWSDLKEY